VAGPWLGRNFFVLGDPLYPLGAPLFHGKGLSGPLWSASKSEIRSNALSYWPSRHLIRVRELGTVLLDRHLSPVGALPALAVGIVYGRSSRTLRLVAVAVAIVLGFGLATGWFWLRSLVPACALIAIGGGVAVDRLLGLVRSSGPAWGSALGASAAVVLAAGVAVSSAAVALGLGIAGPNQSGWTTQLPAGSDFLQPVRDLGSPNAVWWTAFGSDELAWKWLNRHVPAHVRIATFEIRTYGLDRPDDLLYLDGDPKLLQLSSPAANEAYLSARGVRYVFVPAWALGPAATRHPAVDLLPLDRFLGDTSFPLLAQFSPGGGKPLSRIYRVGAASASPPPVEPAVYPGTRAAAPTGDGAYRFPSGDSDARVYTPDPVSGSSLLEFDYLDAGRGRVDVNQYSKGAWRLGFASIDRTGSGRWRHASITVPSDRSGTTELGFSVAGAPFTIRNVWSRSPDGTPWARSAPTNP
jgi:hypothetical protein